MRCLLITAALVATAIALSTGRAAATPSDRFGIQDDAWLRWGPAPFTGPLESRLDTLDTLGVKMVRFTLVWREGAPTATTPPPAPNAPAHDSHACHPGLNRLRAHHT